MRKILLLMGGLLAGIGTGFAQTPLAPGQAGYDEAKAAGQLPLPEQAPPAPNYPTPAQIQRMSTGAAAPALAARGTAAAVLPVTPACSIENPVGNSSFTALARGDDNIFAKITLPFSFSFYGDTYDTVYVNNNGNVSVGQAYTAFSSTGFPSAYRMVAPFWADVDTRNGSSGLIYYQVAPTRLTVIWHQVGYYNAQADLRNTFKLVITNGADPSIGIGNNVAFYYGDMQWTTGSASGGAGGFGGVPATVGINKGSGNNACFFYQLGRFNQAGRDAADIQSIGAGIDYLDNRCFFFNVSAVQPLTANFSHQKYVCATAFAPAIPNPQNCRINSYQWNFGDGGTSTESYPLHAFAQPGTYNVSLTVRYTCGACGEASTSTSRQVQIAPPTNLLQDTLITVSTYAQEKVLQTSASTFSDAWPLPYENTALNTRDSYLNGTKGVWRNEGTYVYQVARQASAPVKTASDGTFTAERFNWSQAELNAIPHWIKAETQTKYSPFSYELESRDVLGVYSATLYDYGGHLSSAIGVNSRHAEMAFTSFEFLEGNLTGNWVFGTRPLPLYSSYTVRTGLDNRVIVEASLQELAGVTAVDVQARGLTSWFGQASNYLQEVRIICKQAHPTHPAWTVLVLQRAPFFGFWSGSLRAKNEVTPLVNPNLDTTFAHAGRSSLKVMTATTFRQTALKLAPAKAYFVSAWVSVKNPQVLVPVLADNLGIQIAFRNEQGTVLSTTTLAPAGPVIEGWQQIRGVVSPPPGVAQPEITFLPGSLGTAWYDDLRLHPEKGNMKTYVYDLANYQLKAILDEENFASFFYYDAEGNLYLSKKETEEGIKTISENVSYLKENQR